ncbi:MAG TPA: sigma-70 family RNA polymerase sigma factor [Gemmataceae bacterium]|jgi:RNA polymerase sigma-70 factor (ECF subfamily)|nr:sigma-70 family RNA polymerase sigma factor [Gemmataceae bacterium]
MAQDEGTSTNPTLLRKLWNPDNDEDAWRAFLDRYRPLIERWCRGAGLDAADGEEVTANVLCQLARAMRTFRYDPAQRFRSWLKTVVVNAVRSYRRTMARRPGARAAGGQAIEEKLENALSRDDFKCLLQDLDNSLESDLQQASRVAANVQQRVEPHNWKAFWQTAIEGRPAAEVAAELHMTVTAVYVAKNRVGKMLRQAAPLPGRDPEGRENAP